MLETKYPSPTGKYHFQIAPWEARMSLWIESPALVQTDTGQTVFTFKNPHWSLDSAEWQDADRVKMSLRHYPGDHTPSSFEAEINCITKQATVGGDTLALDSLEPYLEDLYQRSQRKTPSPTPSRLASVFSRLLGR